jgi:hypothetical protein
MKPQIFSHTCVMSQGAIVWTLCYSVGKHAQISSQGTYLIK